MTQAREAHKTQETQETKNTQTREESADLAAIFPRKGDSRRPPEWYKHALFYALLAVALGYFAWHAAIALQGVLLNIVISLFVAFAIEPVVRWLIAKGWKRNVSAGLTLLFLFILIGTFIGVFGNLMVNQLVSIVSGLPRLYAQVGQWLHGQFDYELPPISNLSWTILGSIKTDSIGSFASQALNTAGSAFGAMLDLLTVILVTYYMSAYGTNMRKVICHYLSEDSQKRFLITWTVVQEQISGFLYSRIVLAVINAICLSIFMIILHVPNWLPLAMACGIISQFVPMIGTYIGGALPAIFAWGTNGIRPALYIIVFIVIYQQIENNLVSPMITRSTMDLNPAISLLGVFAFTAVWGALGGFLALPIIASIQALLSTYLKRYELIDSELLDDPKPVKASKIAQSVQAAGEKISETMMVQIRPKNADEQHITAEDLIRFRESVESTGAIPQSMSLRKSMSSSAASEEKSEKKSKSKTQASSAAPIQPAKPARSRSRFNAKNNQENNSK
ncbi:AI-2E family transporter [Alloscardovia omnicolens]|uniref:AI-2E family transporter n=1 Tax=Alloscardovia omnicolens TaxID=419015 RepID=UPI00254CD616|nr:AI-2E family transporter [Alloscardovia omnicolens]MDK6249444.1 AI-2E family transporter [Alloscardovia omnicolens]